MNTDKMIVAIDAFIGMLEHYPAVRIALGLNIEMKLLMRDTTQHQKVKESRSYFALMIDER